MPAQKRRGEPPVNLKGIVIFLLVVAGLCLYVFYYLPPPPPQVTRRLAKPTPRPKEMPRVADYRPVCRQVSQILNTACRDAGVRERDIAVRKEEFFYQDNGQWLCTEAEVFLPWEVVPESVVRSVTEQAKTIDGFSFRWEKNGEGQGRLALSLKGVTTHAFLFRFKPPQLAIIIDDIGEDLGTTRKILNLGFPLTLSILPDLSHSKQSEELAHRCGYEVMLHLPMQPKNSSAHNPGKNAIVSSMSDSEVRNLVNAQVRKFSYIKGVNNHMGSQVTENEAVTRWVLEALKPMGLYFIDSRTTARSRAFDLARAMGIPSGRSQAFLDNEPGIENCKEEIGKVIERVKRDGKGIVIAHPHRMTLEALKGIADTMREQGVSLVYVSDLVQ